MIGNRTDGTWGKVLRWTAVAVVLTVGGVGWVMRHGVLYASTVVVELGDKFEWEEAVTPLDDAEVLARLGERFDLLEEEVAELDERVTVVHDAEAGTHAVTVLWRSSNEAQAMANELVNVYDELRREAFADGVRKEMERKIEAQRAEVEAARVRMLEVAERLGIEVEEGGDGG